MSSHGHRVKQLLQLSHTGAVTAMAVHPDSLGARYAMLHRGYFGIDVYTVLHIYIKHHIYKFADPYIYTHTTIYIYMYSYFLNKYMIYI